MTDEETKPPGFSYVRWANILNGLDGLDGNWEHAAELGPSLSTDMIWAVEHPKRDCELDAWERLAERDARLR